MPSPSDTPRTWQETAREWAEETIENGPSAFINPGTAEALAQTLLALLARRPERELSEANAARQRAEAIIVQMTAEINAEAVVSRELYERVKVLQDFAQSFADEPCAYGDNCPPFVKLNHYRCKPCQARAALAAGGNDGQT